MGEIKKINFHKSTKNFLKNEDQNWHIKIKNNVIIKGWNWKEQ